MNPNFHNRYKGNAVHIFHKKHTPNIRSSLHIFRNSDRYTTQTRIRNHAFGTRDNKHTEHSRSIPYSHCNPHSCTSDFGHSRNGGNIFRNCRTRICCTLSCRNNNFHTFHTRRILQSNILHNPIPRSKSTCPAADFQHKQTLSAPNSGTAL